MTKIIQFSKWELSLNEKDDLFLDEDEEKENLVFYDPSYFFIKDSRYGQKNVLDTHYAWYDNNIKKYHIIDKRRHNDYYMYYLNDKCRTIPNPKNPKHLKHIEDCGDNFYLLSRFMSVEKRERERNCD